MFSEDITDVHHQLEEVRKQIKKIRATTKNFHKWNSDLDIRAQFLNQIDNILICHSLNTRYFDSQISDIDWLRKVVSFDADSDYYSLLEGYTTYNRNALIYSLSSIVERYIRLLVNSLDESFNINSDFRKVRKFLFKQLVIGEDTDEWKALSTLSNIRNTIHNNGVYSTSDKNLEKLEYYYRGIYVIFQNNKVHYNAKYQLVIYIIVDILRLTKIINNSSLFLEKNIAGNESSI